MGSNSFQDNELESWIDELNARRIDKANYTLIIAYDVTNTYPVYVGHAIAGSATSSAVWRIFKLTYNVNNMVTNKQWADGNYNFDNIWDNRASLSYS